MNGFALLWGKILDSSIWVKESKETRLVWITMLAMKNSDGIIQASVVGLADRAKVSLEECRLALTVFTTPDQDDTSGVEQGRRVRVIPGGWQIINHDLYRFSTEAKREFWKREKASQRQRKQQKKPRPTRRPRDRDGGEAANIRLENAGASQEQLDAHMEEHLPESAKVEHEPLTEAEFRAQLRGAGLSDAEIEAHVKAASEPEVL